MVVIRGFVLGGPPTLIDKSLLGKKIPMRIQPTSCSMTHQHRDEGDDFARADEEFVGANEKDS
jgi:hypothetical protein